MYGQWQHTATGRMHWQYDSCSRPWSYMWHPHPAAAADHRDRSRTPPGQQSPFSPGQGSRAPVTPPKATSAVPVTPPKATVTAKRRTKTGLQKAKAKAHRQPQPKKMERDRPTEFRPEGEMVYRWVPFIRHECSARSHLRTAGAVVH